jgi:hypothetical protein
MARCRDILGRRQDIAEAATLTRELEPETCPADNKLSRLKVRTAADEEGMIPPKTIHKVESTRPLLCIGQLPLRYTRVGAPVSLVRRHPGH